MKIKNIFLLLIFFTFGCGFSPIYLDKKDYKFSIENITLKGDTALNNYLRSNLAQYKKEDAENKFFIEAETIYQKNVLSKDKTGKISNYELTAEVIFEIVSHNKKISFKDEKLFESISDKFQEREYENTIKQNFSKSFSDKLIFELELLR
jgi:outer membrane lipopolysaccharide assembly protein LptE/RlpB